MYSKIALTLMTIASAGIGVAVAQTTPSPVPAKPPAAMTTAPPMVVAPPMATTTPPMSPAPAPTAAITTTMPPAVATSTTPVPPGAPVAGANSFTEGQARSRIEGQGFTDVKNLAKDDQSVWRGTAMKSGVSIRVALDYQGNVVTN